MAAGVFFVRGLASNLLNLALAMVGTRKRSTDPERDRRRPRAWRGLRCAGAHGAGALGDLIGLDVCLEVMINLDYKAKN